LPPLLQRDDLGRLASSATISGGSPFIVQQLSHVVAAAAHDFEPVARNRTQLIRVLAHPYLDCRIALDRAREA
jgi:hypothetical protein